MTAATLFLNKQGKLLIVKPTYRDDDGSLVPGGVIEENESPLEGNKREIREELGMDLAVQQLLCTEYQSAQETRPQSVHFVFYGGLLSQRQIQQIQLPAGELSEFRFCHWDEAERMLCSWLAERLTFALKALEQRTTIYVEDLHEVGKWAQA